MTAGALVLLAVLTAISLPFWADRPPALFGTRWPEGFAATAVLLLALAGWLAVNAPAPTDAGRQWAAGLAVVAALAGGGPAARSFLRLADPGPAEAPEGPARPDLLRGGVWIGALERVAVAATLLARWPEGLALVLAVKGLGRYPELHTASRADRPDAAERFIVGTFASTLWAAGCAGVGLALIH